jgi:mannonate dehydratase
MKNNRREFIKKGTTLAALSLVGMGSGKASTIGISDQKAFSKVEKSKAAPKEPYMKIALQTSTEPSETDIKYIQQLGVDHVVLWTDASKSSAGYYASRKKLYADAGIKVYGFGNSSVHNQDVLVLNLPGRDEKVEEYKKHLRSLGKADIPYTTYAHMGNGIWSSGRELTRGGASARAYNQEKGATGSWGGKRYTEPLSNGRKFTREELWANYEYFIKQAAAVAEEQNVNIGIHPDDPPIDELAGVPRIFSSFDGYKKALEIANSPNVGMCLCVGCWLEGGKLMGRDVIDTIHYFGKMKKIFKVHFRNVNQPLPHFVETFLDDGYADMFKILKALKDVNFNGVLIADHIPSMAYPQTGTAFSIGYMKGLVERVIAEG